MDALVSELAGTCPLMMRARALSVWVGEGRPIAAKGILRRADVAGACAAAGLPDPGRVRSAAADPGLQHAWVAAEGAGLIVVGLDRAVAGTPPGDPLTQWLAGVGALLRTVSHDQHRIGAAVFCRATLGVLAGDAPPDRARLVLAIEQAIDRLPDQEAEAAYRAFGQGRWPDPAALALLVECGAIIHPTMAVTPLGLWAHDALADPVAPTPSWADEDIMQLRIELNRFRPPVWRRVLIPAGMSLGDLHRVIQLVMEWEGDHLHAFTVDGVHFSDLIYGLDDSADEDSATLGSTLHRPRSSIAYRYDLGACWDHTITLEKVVPPEPGARYPTCRAGRGDAPVEYDDPDDPARPPPLLIDDVDARLDALGHHTGADGPILVPRE